MAIFAPTWGTDNIHQSCDSPLWYNSTIVLTVKHACMKKDSKLNHSCDCDLNGITLLDPSCSCSPVHGNLCCVHSGMNAALHGIMAIQGCFYF